MDPSQDLQSWEIMVKLVAQEMHGHLEEVFEQDEMVQIQIHWMEKKRESEWV